MDPGVANTHVAFVVAAINQVTLHTFRHRITGCLSFRHLRPRATACDRVRPRSESQSPLFLALALV